MLMLGRRSLGLLALAGALSIAVCPARARDDVKYPDLKGGSMGSAAARSTLASRRGWDRRRR